MIDLHAGDHAVILQLCMQVYTTQDKFSTIYITMCTFALQYNSMGIIIIIGICQLCI